MYDQFWCDGCGEPNYKCYCGEDCPTCSTKEYMCYLCLKNNPFDIKDLSKDSSQTKRQRAKTIKEIFKTYDLGSVCGEGQVEVDKLKEEQYKLSREL